MNTIRRRLLLWQIGALVITGVLASVLTYQIAWVGFNRIRDYGLEQIAHSVVRHGVRPAAPGRVPRAPAAPAAPPVEAMPVDAKPVDATPGDDEADAGSEADLGQFVSQIWSPDGTLLYASIDEGGPPLQAAGFHVVRWQDEEWRVYTLRERRETVQVAVTSAKRVKAFAEAAPWLLVPLGLLVLLLGLMIHSAVVGALRPLQRLRDEIANRDVLTLHPVPTHDLPVEVAPVGEALNQLMRKVDELMAMQRQFTADVAHELNTPLAAVKLQAQLARRAGDDGRSAALDELDQGIERAIHLVRQLLQLARLEPDVRHRDPRPLRLDQAAAASVAGLSARADARAVDLGLAAADPVTVVADPQDLRVLLENLVDNAVRHAPAGSCVDVAVRRDGAGAVLTVGDHGPGIAAGERERALQRFVRLDPQDATGSGLGLAIVAAIVEQSAGRLVLDDTPGGGLTVRVVLPAATDRGAGAATGSG